MTYQRAPGCGGPQPAVCYDPATGNLTVGGKVIANLGQGTCLDVAKDFCYV